MNRIISLKYKIVKTSNDQNFQIFIENFKIKSENLNEEIKPFPEIIEKLKVISFKIDIHGTDTYISKVGEEQVKDKYSYIVNFNSNLQYLEDEKIEKPLRIKINPFTYNRKVDIHMEWEIEYLPKMKYQYLFKNNNATTD